MMTAVDPRVHTSALADTRAPRRPTPTKTAAQERRRAIPDAEYATNRSPGQRAICPFVQQIFPDAPSLPKLAPDHTLRPVSPSHPWLSRLAGRFIVFEGPDGSGKTTQFLRFVSHARANGLAVCDVREPGGTPIGERIRAILLDHAHHDIDIVCEMLLYMASRAQLVRQVIRPALAAGEIVVADRFISSTLAYQGSAGGVPETHIRTIGEIATAGIVPDLVVIFDVDEDIAAKRLNPLLDRMEAKGRDFHRKVRQGYLDQARRDPTRHLVLDASISEADVWEALLSGIRERLVGAT